MNFKNVSSQDSFQFLNSHIAWHSSIIIIKRKKSEWTFDIKIIKLFWHHNTAFKSTYIFSNSLYSPLYCAKHTKILSKLHKFLTGFQVKALPTLCLRKHFQIVKSHKLPSTGKHFIIARIITSRYYDLFI